MKVLSARWNIAGNIRGLSRTGCDIKCVQKEAVGRKRGTFSCKFASSLVLWFLRSFNYTIEWEKKNLLKKNLLKKKSFWQSELMDWRVARVSTRVANYSLLVKWRFWAQNHNFKSLVILAVGTTDFPPFFLSASCWEWYYAVFLCHDFYLKWAFKWTCIFILSVVTWDFRLP